VTRWSDEDQYADAPAYFSRRAELVVSVGARLEPGDSVLDLACADGRLADFLAPYGIGYRGIDTIPAMVEQAHAHGIAAEVGDLNDYTPPEPVAATLCFRAIYYARDRAAFFRHAAGYTTRKLVFDLNPRQYPLATIRAELLGAGFARVDVRPLFAPQRVKLPRAAGLALRALERSGPLARLALRYRFTYVVAASRDRGHHQATIR
jgi:SAM-dependent methyltransferase